MSEGTFCSLNQENENDIVLVLPQIASRLGMMSRGGSGWVWVVVVGQLSIKLWEHVSFFCLENPLASPKHDTRSTSAPGTKAPNPE